MSCIESFNVLFTKDNLKKRKAYQDGVFTINKSATDSCVFSLFDESGSVVKKVTDKVSKFSVRCGTEFMFGMFGVQVEGVAKASDSTGPSLGAPPLFSSKKPFTASSMGTNSNSLGAQLSSSSSGVLCRPLPGSLSAGSQPKKATAPLEVSLDASLLKVMRPHQVVAAQFLLQSLTGSGPSSADDPTAKYSLDQGGAGDERFKGAILADEMGLGKTLTAISVLWAFVRQGACKGVVVCPSSLVDNWEKECKQWLGVKLKPLCVKPGAGGATSDSTVSAFVIGHCSLTPVLIISYEMFRKHASQLNLVPGLDVLICDEGHRLKNVDGTKTIQALTSCKARRRVVLSGTPIQNDLDELFSVVNFVKPGFLGSLSEFKSDISGPIVRGSEPDASERARAEGDAASARLRAAMGGLMMRRTQGDILSKCLPPRSDYVVYCRLTAAQEQEYGRNVESINASIGYIPLSAENDEEAEEDCRSIVNASLVLPGLQLLRKICIFGGGNDKSAAAFATVASKPMFSAGGSASGCSGGGSKYGSSISTDASESQSETVPPVGSQGSNSQQAGGAFRPASSFGKFVAPSSTGPVAAKSSVPQGAIVSKACGISSGPMSSAMTGPASCSSKLQFLVALVGALQSAHSEEKVVVVSNFTSTLDQVQALAAARGWGEVLRVDGKVPVDKRQNLIDCFNRPSDRRFLFLLSSKAGGVGINLIGGSRLVMCDPDWNPATDKQAMSRVWREGQKRPVFIYRLVAEGRIEEAILNRQYSKSGLASSLTVAEAVDPDEDADPFSPPSGPKSGGARTSLTRRDLQLLMLPSGPVAAREQGVARGGGSVLGLRLSDDEFASAAEEDEEEGEGEEDETQYVEDEVLRAACERLKGLAVIARVEKRSAEFY